MRTIKYAGEMSPSPVIRGADGRDYVCTARYGSTEADGIEFFPVEAGKGVDLHVGRVRNGEYKDGSPYFDLFFAVPATAEEQELLNSTREQVLMDRDSPRPVKCGQERPGGDGYEIREV